uniref:Uncharacterized protein n=1 Tax=Chromera velia CCMP2878 TaxID=1169474 RepID=A0A0G4FZN8_9ALVE|eukprot:Cvel_19575.t1-p1 / transcript=Cvel_19575.t1 / gene=Cvel_19575 / organism=Chromera_velia_CCMP2878 / gene_product=hypothetical protein / transcript_product=hypothetical protein / location=Cvel_scaffold1698:29114-30484(+) / protein_length=208 / sequence_SO=supercontig / SO=protein_coding / is_pseudo=false
MQFASSIGSSLLSLAMVIWLSSVASGVTPRNLFTTQWSTFVVDSEGLLYACGRNHQGQLGVGDQTERTSPTRVGVGGVVTVSNVTGVCGSVAEDAGWTLIAADGRVFFSGKSSLSPPSPSFSTSPVLVLGLDDAKGVACPSSTSTEMFAWNSSGHLFSWGSGLLGRGSASESAALPVELQIPSAFESGGVLEEVTGCLGPLYGMNTRA